MNRPRPVLTKAGIAGAATSIAGVLTFLGYDKAAAHLSAETTTIVATAIGVVTLASHLLAALSAQKDVTPKAKPQADDGMPLIRADQAVQLPQYAVSTFTGKHEAPDDGGVQLAALDVPDATQILAAANEIHPAPDSASG